jgi:putative DNA primase/helicase
MQTVTPIETLLGRLPDARKSGNGWSARCPAHEDRKASLSVSETDDGIVLLKCHAGCDTDQIVEAIGLKLRDLFPEQPDWAARRIARNGRSHGKPRAERPPPRAERPLGEGQTFATARDALAALDRQLGRHSCYWTYTDSTGSPTGIVVRWDRPEGKTIRPVSRRGDGWVIGAMPEPRPLYRLPEVLAAEAAQPVLVVEGEKAAVAAQSIGFTSTTSSGGSQAAAKTDWSPLAGKEVWILPDNDAPGRKYAETVANILAKLSPAPAVRVVELPGLPEGGDIADWVDAHGNTASPEQLRAELEELARSAKPWTPVAEPRPASSSKGRVEPDLLCLADVEARPVPWLWPGRIPLGRLVLLVGRPGAGKSFLTCDLAARVSTGAAWPDLGIDRAPLGDTLLICAEDDPADTIRPRLDAAGANCRRVHLLKAAKILSDDGDERSVAFDLSNVDLIRDALARLPDCKLAVVDPVGSFIGGQVDSYRDNEVRAVLAPLAALAAERGVAILLVCHTRKAPVPFADDATLGSRAFVGLARSILHLAADPDDESRNRKLLLAGKCNLAGPLDGLAFRIVGSPPRLDWELAPVRLRADDLVARPPDQTAKQRGPKPQARSVAVDWLANLLDGGPLPVSEIKETAKSASFSWSTVRRASETLGITPVRQGFGPEGAWFWAMPDQDVPVSETDRPPTIDAQVNPIDAQVSPIDAQVTETWASMGKPEHLCKNESDLPKVGLPQTGDSQTEGGYFEAVF